jgi:hypothetical protein
MLPESQRYWKSIRGRERKECVRHDLRVRERREREIEKPRGTLSRRQNNFSPEFSCKAKTTNNGERREEHGESDNIYSN